MHYHLQEMPSKKALAKMDPAENFTIPKSKKSKKPVVKDLDGEIIGGSEDDDNEELDQDASFKMANSLANDYFDESSREKSYTLTMICDPEDSGIEKIYIEYKRWLIDNKVTSKPKRMIINAN